MKYCILLLTALIALPLAAEELPAKIQDNSFLIEEAYNQEAGIVQHINTFDISPENNAWEYSFTQEWPVVSQKHQASYTISWLHQDEGPNNTGFGDMALHYRYQAVHKGPLAFAPRFSILLPTGDHRDGFGNDSLGYEAALPFSADLNDSLTMHWNFGFNFAPDARGVSGPRESVTGAIYGTSLVYHAAPLLNILVELAGTSSEVPGEEDREETLFILPGVRAAINFENGLQIVPGIGVPIGIGPSEGDYSIFAYLSFEHSYL